jgi:phosphate acyltransferase
LKIALDAMGGDLAPSATVEGAVRAARESGLEIILVGDHELLSRELARHETAGLKLHLHYAAEVVAMADSPLESALGKPDSSIHAGFELLKRGEVQCFVSAGNSGAVMAAGMMILGTLPGVDRPAIASLVPANDDFVLLIDAGANVEVKPHNLAQFAVMGSVYWRQVRGMAHPRVGILSNGEEDSKGNDLTRAAAAMLKELSPHINYVGYVEGRDINRAKAEVVVTDGFTGNVALKTMEGLASFMFGNLRELFFDSTRGRLAYFLVRRKLHAMRTRLDPTEYGGAPLLGLNGIAIIAHGSSSAHAIHSALRAAANETLSDRLNAEITELLDRSRPDMVPVKSGKGIRAILSRMRERLHLSPKESEAQRNSAARSATGPLDGTAGAGLARGTAHSASSERLLNGDRPEKEKDRSKSSRSASYANTGIGEQESEQDPPDDSAS